MLFTLTCTEPVATDIGFLLHKHPDRVQKFTLPFGQAHTYYPEATPDRCTFALQVDVDPIALARTKGGHQSSIAGYVNDRPYAAGSMLSTAIARVLGSALKGKCQVRPDLAKRSLPLEIRIPAVPARAGHNDPGGPELVKRLFGPLGWKVAADVKPYGPSEWGDSPYVDVTLSGDHQLSEALNHLYVLLPVLDGTRHYFASPEDLDKLIRSGEGWLGNHPERDLIATRYLARREWVNDLMGRWSEQEDVDKSNAESPSRIHAEDTPRSLRQQRRDAVVEILREVNARTVVDAGCGEGFYIRALLDDPSFTRIMGIDVSPTELERAEKRLNLERLPEQQRRRVTLRQSSVTYRDDELTGFDAIVLAEVIEHIDPQRLDSMETNIFHHAHPRTVIVTTPNRDYNVHYGLKPGDLRHPDHRFEWSRTEFEDWARGVGIHHGYAVELRGIGESKTETGSPTQLALFFRQEGGAA